MAIYNSTEKTFSPSAQQAINNAMANAGAGLDNVYAAKSPTDGNNGTIFDLYDEDENYKFSIDTEGDVIFGK